VDLVAHWEEFIEAILPRYLRYVVGLETAVRDDIQA